MLFTSWEFILVYLPCVCAAFFLLARFSRKLAALFLGLASLFFYGWWDARFVPLLAGSICFNYLAGYALASARPGKKMVLGCAVAANLALLAWFKYANFFIGSLRGTGLVDWTSIHIILPLGISFFTFTQIAFLVDVARGEVKEYSFVHYLLFVTYFPHLIAGPLLHHKQMMPQFAAPSTYAISAQNLSYGMIYFLLGMAKKVLIADTMAECANPVFATAEAGGHLPPGLAWLGAAAYALQLYFDFSGYSDMAIGISALFGVSLPLNFNSPYQSVNIIDFWRRWHITLSVFLRDYLYIPLGGNRKGRLRRHGNLLVTMLLGGLWHGASWTFVVWGGLHGLYLMINHAWHALRKKWLLPQGAYGWTGRFAATGLTFLAVLVAWVFFRAETFHGAARLLVAMSGATAVPALAFAGTNPDTLAWARHFDAPAYYIIAVAVALGLAWFFPNSQAIMKKARLRTGLLPCLAIGAGAFWVVLLCVIAASRGRTEFIYFNF